MYLAIGSSTLMLWLSVSLRLTKAMGNTPDPLVGKVLIIQLRLLLYVMLGKLAHFQHLRDDLLLVIAVGVASTTYITFCAPI